MLSKRRFRPQPHSLPAEPLQTVPDLANLLDGKDGTLPLPETILYPPGLTGVNAWSWLLMACLGCCVTGGIAAGAFFWLVNLPPRVDCETISPTASDRAQLFCAQVAAETGDLEDILAGLDLLGSWSTDHPLYHEVQPLVDQWSATVLVSARRQLDQNNLQGAIALVNRIPPRSSLYAEGRAVIAQWQTQWQQGEAIFTQAQTALQEKDWETASNQVLALAELDNPYWNGEKVQMLSRQISQEKRAQQLLSQAVARAAAGGIEQLSEAIRAASQISPDTYAWQEAQPFLDRWSDELLGVALDKWYAADLEEAIALGQRVALNPNRQQVAQELVWLSQARQLAQRSVSTWRTSLDQVISLYRAMLVVNQIPTDSRFYPQAQSSLTTWRTHLEALGHLQVAQALGRWQNRDVLALAIDRAQTVPPGNPRRQQAQTLIAHWQKEIERIEDRPYLTQAQTLAKANTIEGLQAAIRLASQIQPGRSLRPDAQGWIYVWNFEIERIEDQPILDHANALAAEGDLSQAIVEAGRILPDRALYDDAQAAIANWQARIRAIELANWQAQQEALDIETTPFSTPAPQTLAEEPSPRPLSSPQIETVTEPQWSDTPSLDFPPSPLPDQIETVPGEERPMTSPPPAATTPAAPGTTPPVLESVPDPPVESPPTLPANPAPVMDPPAGSDFTPPSPMPDMPTSPLPNPSTMIEEPPSSLESAVPAEPPAGLFQPSPAPVPTVSAMPTGVETDIPAIYLGPLYAGM